MPPVHETLREHSGDLVVSFPQHGAEIDPRAFRPSRNVTLLTGVMTAKAVTDLG